MIMGTSRLGFTLVELMVAVLLLGTVILGVGAATSRMSRVAVLSAQETAALDLAEERIAEVMADPAYDSLEVRYQEVESGLPGAPGLYRSTQVARVRQTMQTGRVLDFKRVTVRVEGPGLLSPVSRSTTRAAP